MKKIIITFFACIIACVSFGQANTYFHNRIDTTIFAVADTVGHGANHYFATNTSADFNVKQYVNGDAVNIFFKKGVTGTATLALITKTGTLSSKTIKKPNGQNLSSGDIRDSTSLLLTFFGTYWRCDPTGNMASTPTVTITGAGTTTVTSSGVGTTTPSYTIASSGSATPTVIITGAGTTTVTSSGVGTTTPSYTITSSSQSVTPSWSLTGNSGTTAGTNFLGTTDDQDMVFKRNSSEVMRLYSLNNFVGIGTAIPSAILNVNAPTSTVSTTYDFIISKNNIGAIFMGTNSDGSGAVAIENAAHNGNIFSLNNQITDTYDYWNSGRNLGIGTISPPFKLSVNSSLSDDFITMSNAGTVQAAMGYRSNGGYLGLNNTAGNLEIVRFNNPAGNDFIKDGNNLDLIADKTSVFGLNIQNTNNTGSPYSIIYFGDHDGTNQGLIALVGTGNSAYGGAQSLVLGTNNAKPIVFISSGVEKVRMTANGAMAFGGASNYGSSGQILVSNGDASPTWQNPDNGSFIDTITQTSAGATSVNKMKFRVTEFADGVTIVNDTAITISHTGTYNIQFSVQANKSDGGADDIDIWLRRNGTNLSYTNGRQTISNVGGSDVVGWNILVQATAGDYFTWVWSSADTAMQLLAQSGLTSPVRASIPSTALSVNKIK